VIWLLALITTGTANAADARPMRSCIDEHEHAQELARGKRLREARDAFLHCAQKECPELVREDCTRLAAEVEAALPSMVPSAERKGEPLVETKVFVDGTLALDRLNGTAIVIDPGEHVVRFENSDGQRIEKRVFATEGQKLVPVTVSFPVDAGQGHSSSAPAARAEPSRGLGFVTIALGGVALAGAGVFTWAGLSGKADERALERSCGTACDPRNVDPIRTQYLVADVALGVAVLAAAGAVLVQLTRKSEPAH
jgi:hypothetical protein